MQIVVTVATAVDTKSMKNSSLRYLFNRVYLAHFDVDVRKLTFGSQTCTHCVLIVGSVKFEARVREHPKSLAIHKLQADYPIFGGKADIAAASQNVR